MRSVLVPAFLTVILASGPAFAQDASAPETPETTEAAPEAASQETQAVPAPEATAQARQPAASRDEVNFGEAYLNGTYTDWTLRCIKIDEPQDLCEMHQSLSDENGTRTAEFNLFPLDRGQIAAGGTIVTPLETVLTENVRLSVDGGEMKLYPFTFCNRVGCVAQVGFLADEIATFRRGRTGTVQIVPLAAPDQTVTLNISLAGFTAAFEALTQ